MALLELLTTGVAGVVFGLALAAPPGPMNAVIAEETVLGGFRPGVLAGAGAMLADITFFVLAALGMVSLLQRLTYVQGTMVAIGGLLMLYFAVDAVRELDLTVTDFESADPHSDTRGFRRAFLLALTNPYQIIFWLTVGVGLLSPGTVDVLSYTPYLGDRLAGLLIVHTGEPALIAGLFGGITIWIVGFPATLSGAGKRIDRFAPAVAIISALFLAGFGVFFLWDAGKTFGLL